MQLHAVPSTDQEIYKVCTGTCPLFLHGHTHLFHDNIDAPYADLPQITFVFVSTTSAQGNIMSKNPLCVMVGPAPEAQGGMASVIQVYAESGLFSNGQVRLLPSFSDGSKLHKLITATKALCSYASLLIRGKGEVLHVHVASDASFWRKAMFIWLAVLWRRKIIFHLHSGGFIRFIEALPAWKRCCALATIRHSDQLLCLSTPAATWLRQIAPLVPLRFWPNPIPAYLFESTNTETQAAQRAPLLLYLGALLPAKGVAELLQAFSTLFAKNPDARLIMAGNGPALAQLQAQAVTLGVSEQVSFPGWIGPDEKNAWLRSARVLALASHTEAQPMVLLEAMACGAAVVSTSVGGIPDLIKHEVHGLLAPAHDAAAFATQLLRAWEDAALHQRLVQAARTHVAENHHALQVRNALLNLYMTLADGQPGNMRR